MLHVEQKHAAGVGIIGAVHAGQAEVDVVLGQHDLLDAGKVLRLVLAHPEDFRRGEAGEGDVGGQGGEPLLADDAVEVFDLLLRASVIPENGTADDLVILIEDDEPVHLPAAADAGHVGGVGPLQQLVHAVDAGGPPGVGILLRPARLREVQRVFPADLPADPALFVNEGQLDCRGAEIDSDKQFRENHLR